MNRLTTFEINEVHFGIAIENVIEVIQIPRYTRLPNTYSYIMGIFNHRGSFLGLFDIGQIFGLGDTNIQEDSKCILIGNGKFSAGILVTNLHHLIEPKVSESLNSDLTSVAPGIKRFVDGYIKIKNDKFYVLNVDKLFLSEEFTVYL
ncbi:MAG: hypothetical protein Kow00108_23680 [Calditrichia bacterium]